MDYSNIETFIVIAETRSLTKAAERLFLSQSTISYRLKALEQEIGTELIHREQGKGFITLTPKGEEFMNIADRWVSLYRDIELWKTQKPSYKLNIGSVDSLNTYVFYELYKKIIKEDANLIINVSSHWTVTIYKMIENHEIDIGFVLWEIPYREINCRPLFSEKMVLISSADSNLPKIVHTSDLNPNKEMFMYHGPNFQAWHDNIWENNTRKSFTVDTASLLRSFMDVPNFWSIVPVSIAKKFSSSVAISEIADSPPERICYQVTNKNPITNKIKALECFDDILEDFLKSDFLTSILN